MQNQCKFHPAGFFRIHARKHRIHNNSSRILLKVRVFPYKSRHAQ